MQYWYFFIYYRQGWDVTSPSSLAVCRVAALRKTLPLILID